MSPSALWASLTGLWQQWSPAERGRFAAAAVGCLLAIVAVVYWSSRPEYVLLAEGLAPTTAHDAVTALDAQGIGYELGFSGTTISVSRTDLNKARLALREVLPTEAESTSETAPMSDLWSDPATIQQRQTRDLETRIAQSIGRLKGVKSAQVHLTRPQRSPFVRERQPAKASVILDLGESTGPTALDTQAVISVVAHSVEGLDPTHITLVDTAGRLLSSNKGLGSSINSQMEYRTWLESHLAAKAEAMLVPLLGEGKSHVRVTADVDFTELTREEIRFDPDSKVKVSEIIRSEESGNTPVASGPAGSGSNIGWSVASNSSGSSKKEDIDTTYENSKTVDSIRELPGQTKRLTIAAVVELPEGEASAAALTQAQVEGIIKQAVGFDTSRADSIEVVVGKLQSLATPAPTLTWWDHLQAAEPLIRSASLGLGALVALLFGFLLLRRIPQQTTNTVDEEQILSMRRQLDRLQDEVRDDPEHVAALLADWLTASADDNGTEGTVRTDISSRREAA